MPGRFWVHEIFLLAVGCGDQITGSLRNCDEATGK